MKKKDFYRVLLENFAKIKGTQEYESLMRAFESDENEASDLLVAFADENAELILKELAIFEMEGEV